LVTVGDAITVSQERVRGEEDPLMRTLRERLETLLDLPHPQA
jgi:hypothetical protein